MVGYVTLGTNDLERAAKFYDELLAVLGANGGDGLPAWTKANRSIENADVVLWYTLGFHHVVRNEDWPAMPVSVHEFSLRPFGFFPRNPALDLPRE